MTNHECTYPQESLARIEQATATYLNMKKMLTSPAWN